ncbi:MAG TPA: hypothetical protein DHU78_03585 [Opitutae bacterium]|nr:hypothetical protein [Opitutae bacterium]|tara:strand:- start:13324 stop:14094 length:771 start_codon:yes stop_codon:yes gene_type:complete
MNWWGKLIGTGVGLLGGPVGALVGAAIGHLYDGNDRAPLDEQKARILYFAYFFSCAGKIAKADGVISASEIEATESIMERFRLNEKNRVFAKNVFRKAKTSKRPIADDFKELAELIQYDSTVAQSFLGGLFEIVRSNGEKLNKKQIQYLLIGEESLRIPPGTIKTWIAGGYAPPLSERGDNAVGEITLAKSFKILSIPSSSNETEIKKAYREKVSHFHPDKLESKQLPKEFIEFANSQLAKINQAYHTIKKARENS